MRKNAWTTYDETTMRKVEEVNARYKDYLNRGKTERECVRIIVEELEKNGYQDIAKLR